MKQVQQFTKHGSFELEKESKYDSPVYCMDSEGNLFPSFSYAARFHNVSPSTASSCNVKKPNFKSKHYNKKVSICVITEEEYNNGRPHNICFELVTRRAAGENIYLTEKNPMLGRIESNLIIKNGVYVNRPYWTGMYYEDGDTFRW